MAEFSFVKNPKSKKWVILAPRRGIRPDDSEVKIECPFCVGIEEREAEIYRVGGEKGDKNWQVIVVPNKYPFSSIHELIIDSPSHTDSIETFPQEHVEKLLSVYKERFMHNHYKGQVCIFHNRGKKAGESINHSHTQLVVIPDKVNLPSIRLSDVVPEKQEDVIQSEYFDIFCPQVSEWPDEVWIMPKKRGVLYGEVKDKEIPDLAYCLQTILRLLSLRHQNALPYNFYIYHAEDWYLRIVPREKVWGGFEVATNVSVNTQNPKETFAFLNEHFFEADIEKIFREHKADYERRV